MRGGAGTPQNLSEVNSPDEDFGPSLTADGTALYFLRSPPATTPAGLSVSLYRATRADPAAPFGAPELVPGFGATYATIGPDDLTLYTIGPENSNDLYASRRPDRMSPFGAPENLTALNSGRPESLGSQAADLGTIYFTSKNYPTGGSDASFGSYDIYSADWVCP